MHLLLEQKNAKPLLSYQELIVVTQIHEQDQVRLAITQLQITVVLGIMIVMVVQQSLLIVINILQKKGMQGGAILLPVAVVVLRLGEEVVA